MCQEPYDRISEKINAILRDCRDNEITGKIIMLQQLWRQFEGESHNYHLMIEIINLLESIRLDPNHTDN